MREHRTYDLLSYLLLELSEEEGRVFEKIGTDDPYTAGEIKALNFAKNTVRRYLNELDESEVPEFIRRIKGEKIA